MTTAPASALVSDNGGQSVHVFVYGSKHSTDDIVHCAL